MQKLTQNKANQNYNYVPVFSLKLIKEKSIKYSIKNLSNSNQVAIAMQAYLGDKDCEHLAVCLLDGNNNMLGIVTASIGSISSANSTIRDIFKHAIVGRASAIVLSHNHSSGNVQPSKEDIEFTKKAIEAGKLLGIPVVDHVIISSGIEDQQYSFLSELPQAKALGLL